MKGGAKVVIEAHRHEGVFIARSKEDALVTLNSTPGKDVYGEKRIQVDGPAGPDGTAVKLEYRVWNPFRSKLAAAILGGIDNIHMGPGLCPSPCASSPREAHYNQVRKFFISEPLLGRPFPTCPILSDQVELSMPWSLLIVLVVI
jgi:hypothetical protein